MDIDVSTDVLESTAGLIFIGKIFKKIGMLGSKSCLRTFKGSSAIKTMAGLLVQRRTKFEESGLFQNSSLFSKILELKKVPAPETVRLYLEKLSETCAGKLMATLRRINIRLLKRVSLDSGNDSLDTLKVLIQSGDYFLFKRNLRHEAVGKYISATISLGHCGIPREGKEVYTATLTGCHPQAGNWKVLLKLTKSSV